uniref:Uncharacterized protein n=1 Tax=Panagrolaimus sp. JU765 TaxID=591449 RepID=A0AC34Q4I2_9BILA
MFGLEINGADISEVLLYASLSLKKKQIDQSLFDYLLNFGCYVENILKTALDEPIVSRFEKPQNYEALKFFSMNVNSYSWPSDDLKNVDTLNKLLKSVECLIEKYMIVQVDKFEKEKYQNVSEYQILREASEMAKKK